MIAGFINHTPNVELSGTAYVSIQFGDPIRNPAKVYDFKKINPNGFPLSAGLENVVVLYFPPYEIYDEASYYNPGDLIPVRHKIIS